MHERSARLYHAIYETKDYEAESRRLDELIRAHKVSPGERLLDVACGEGQLLGFAHSRGIEPHGVDLSDVALRAALASAPAAIVSTADGESLP